MIGRLLRIAGDPDMRGYVRWAAARPSAWRVRRPDLTSRQPPYLAAAKPVELATPVVGPLLEWGDGPLRGIPFRLAATSVDRIDWKQPFTDLEDEASLHRFAWLLPWMAAQRGASTAALWDAFREWRRSWLAIHPSPAKTEAWQAYTTSERIVNWIIAALAVGQSPVAGVEDALRMHARHLLDHLEYYGEDHTGNHLANNGRALYFAGAFLGDAAIAAAGRSIILNECRRLFGNGFLREDSTHYQHLVTRNYAEALWLARAAGDAEVIADLAEPVQAMERACAFFNVGESFPLIGDISPDCAPEWRGLIWRFAERGQPPVAPPSWGRLDRGRWTVFAHVNGRGAPFRPGHAHNDTGGIVAFHDGTPVIVEAGRRTYKDDDAGRFGLGGASHSLLMVDHRDPAPPGHWLVSDRYALGDDGRHPSVMIDGARLVIRHSGFSRIRGVGEAQRTVGLDTQGNLEIEDVVAGRGSHVITLVFHTTRADVLRLPSDLTDVRTWHAPEDSETLGWGTPRYGDRSPLFSVVAEGRCELPWRGVTTCAAS